MDALFNCFVILIMMIFLLSMGVWIFPALILVSFGGLYLLLGYPLDIIGVTMVKRVIGGAGGWEIACIPLFMLMGELIFRSDISDRLFKGLAPLVDKLPGRLLHTNVAGCAIFAAVSGSSAVTTATIGKITIPELQKRGYDNSLAMGSLAGAGSFGLMIPPSIIFIIYGVLAEESISKLFVAGIFPGLLLAGLFSFYIFIRALLNPAIAPGIKEVLTFKKALNCLGLLSPIISLILVVMGSIYTGIATPTESAAVGVAMSIILVMVLRQFTLSLFINALLEALKSSCMVCTLLASAAFLSTAMGFMHIPQDVSLAISAMNLTPYGLIIVLGVFYIVLGCFLDGVSITVMSLPICLPLIIDAGFSPIWFGIFLVAMTEVAQITPPIGFNLFILQGLTNQPIGRVVIAAAPFFFLIAFGVFLITLFPQIALWLPAYLLGG